MIELLSELKLMVLALSTKGVDIMRDSNNTAIHTIYQNYCLYEYDENKLPNNLNLVKTDILCLTDYLGTIVEVKIILVLYLCFSNQFNY